jgi:hypothetical protein
VLVLHLHLLDCQFAFQNFRITNSLLKRTTYVKILA